MKMESKKKIEKLGFFQRGWSMVFVKNLKFFHLFIFGKIRQENLFDNILEGKKAFLDSKIKKLKNSKNRDFSKGVSPWCGKKFEIFACFYFCHDQQPKYVECYSRK